MELMNRRVAAALLFCAYLCFFFFFFFFFFSTCGANGDSPSGRGKRVREAASLGQGSGSGPGSYPPRCTLKCGECSPCNPVHVPVPPGTPVIAEYYPEAWRCKCGNLLFMP